VFGAVGLFYDDAQGRAISTDEDLRPGARHRSDRALFVQRQQTPPFDHARMAATLTSITRIPYDAQHLPFTTVRFVKKDTDARMPSV
jgi:hypothetical protein